MDMEILADIAIRATSEPVYPNALFPPSLYYRFLKLLAQAKQAKVMVELGVCGGGGSLHLALGSPDGIVVGVDIAYDHHEHIQHIKSVCPNFHFAQMDSAASAKYVYETFGPVDILFIDTDHTFERTLSEYKAYFPYLAKGAVVCFDDLFRPGMQEAWDAIHKPKIRLDFLHDGCYPVGGGFGVHVHTEASPVIDYQNDHLLGC